MATQSLYFPTISPVSPISKHQSCAISVKHHCSLAKRRETSRNGRLGKLNVSIESERLQSVERSHGKDYGVVSIHHVGILCENLERSLDFYKDLLGLEVNLARPNDKLPYRGAWLWVGSEMIHLMELPNPDPLTGRPEHGGRDRHTCIAIRDVSKLKAIFDEAGFMKITLEEVYTQLELRDSFLKIPVKLNVAYFCKEIL